MIQPARLNRDIFQGYAPFLYVIEVPARLHLAHVHREVRGSHLFVEYSLQVPRATGRVEYETRLGIVVKRPKKWNALDVIPMEVGDKKMSKLRGSLALPVIAKYPDSGAAIEDVG